MPLISRINTNTPSSTLFVTNVPPDATVREMSHIFRLFDGFRCVRFVPHVSKSSRYDSLHTPFLCFVEYETPMHATVAMNSLQDYQMDITVCVFSLPLSSLFFFFHPFFSFLSEPIHAAPVDFVRTHSEEAPPDVTTPRASQILSQFPSLSFIRPQLPSLPCFFASVSFQQEICFTRSLCVWFGGEDKVEGWA